MLLRWVLCQATIWLLLPRLLIKQNCNLTRLYSIPDTFVILTRILLRLPIKQNCNPDMFQTHVLC